MAQCSPPPYGSASTPGVLVIPGMSLSCKATCTSSHLNKAKKIQLRTKLGLLRNQNDW